jgi:hypothetical protein
MAIPVDPDLGFVEFEFTVASAPLPDGTIPPDTVVVADVDVYHAAELAEMVRRRYFKEMEEAGTPDQTSRHEELRRWLTLLFKTQPQVDVQSLSFRAMAGIQSAVYDEIERLAKKGHGSSAPDSPASTTGTTAGPTG